jgi:hypothetical protein
MNSLLATPRRRIGIGLVIITWCAVQFLLALGGGLHFASIVGLGLQVGIAAAFIYSGIALRAGPH